MWKRLECSAPQNRELHTLLWTQQFSWCLCSNKFEKKKKKCTGWLTLRKEKQKQGQGGKKKGKLQRKKISQCNLLSVSPNVLVSTTRPLVECGDKRQSTAQVVALRKRERQSLAATHRSSRSSLVALVPSTDQTAHCTVLHWPSSFLLSMFGTQALAHTLRRCRPAVFPRNVHTRMGASLYITTVSPCITTCLRSRRRRRRRRLAVLSLERTILGSCARHCAPPLDHG